MDFSNKIYMYEVRLDDSHNEKPPYTFSANIVFIDLGNEGGFPRVYQLKDFFQQPEKVQQEEVAWVGTVDCIQRKEKRILLSDGSVVLYNHLIIIKPARQETLPLYSATEFAAGMQTLMDALRMRDQFSFDCTVVQRVSLARRPAHPLERGQVSYTQKNGMSESAKHAIACSMNGMGIETLSAIGLQGSEDRHLFEIIL